MAKNTPDVSRSGLGDLTNILHNQGLSDLSWLDVNEDDYRAAEALPRQNLDVIPELQRALSMDGEADRDGAVPQLIPIRPSTLVNSNPLGGSGPKADMTAPIRNRVARMVMTGLAGADILGRLRLEFPDDDIRTASEAIREVLSERGLIGNVYVDAAHFPNAASDPEEKKFARSAGRLAMFVIGGCGGKNGCNCHETGMCNTFGGKRVVSEVPYGANVAAYYAPRLAVEKRPLELGTPDDDAGAWKGRLQAAFLRTPLASMPDGIRTVQTQQPKPGPSPVSMEDVRAFVERGRAAGSDPIPSPEYVKYARRMQAGHDDRAVLVASTDPHLRALASEYGLLGHTYIDVDVAGGCSQALEVSRQLGLSPDFVVRRSASCPQCDGDPGGACAQLCAGSQLVHARPAVDRLAFGRALKRAAVQGRLPLEKARTAASKAPASADWPSLTAQANLYSPPGEVQAAAAYSGPKLHAHHGSPGRSDVSVATEMDPEEVRRTLSHMMNTGLSGRALQRALLQRYSTDDLRQVPEVGRQASVDDGVQGRYFVDPTAYSDYGRGCSDGASHFRKQGAPYVLASTGCTGCTLQTAPGWCSKYAKGLIRQVPSEIREKVASERRSLPVVASAPVTNPVEEFELSSELTVDTAGGRSKNIDVTIKSGSLGD